MGDFVDVILGVLGSSGFGAVLGAISGIFTRWEERKNLELRYQHEQVMAEHQTSHAVTLAEVEKEGVQVAGRLAIEKTEAKGFADSQTTDSPVADGVRAFVRPVILAVLLGATCWIFYSLNNLVGGLQSLEFNDVVELYKATVLMVLSLTSMGVSWYFAQRSSKHFDRLLNSLQTRP